PIFYALSICYALLSETIIKTLFHKIKLLSAIVAVTLISFLSVNDSIQIYLAPPSPKYELYKKTAEWLNEHAPLNSRVGINEVGIFGYYYTNGSTIDGLGLITSGGTDGIRTGEYSWYISKYEPDYLAFIRPRRATLEGFQSEKWFKRLYKKATIIESGRLKNKIYQRRAIPLS
ncbi:MAG: hypothetical protein KDD53_02315, partial [Bdellovibrionales bacterium]|nr:hypothetical protein [Bdellovibrionales bacterium]